MHLTRRHALAWAGFAALTACTSRRPAAPALPPDPDVPLRDAAVAREQALLAAYDDAVAVAPALAGRLAPLRAEHAAHLAALTAATPGPSASAPAVPVQPPQAAPTGLAGLARLERQSAAGHAAAAVTASRRLAPVLASLAASEASHTVALTP